MTTADRIKNRRLELGLTQLEVAKRLGLTSKAAVSKVEGQGDNVTLKNVEKFAKVLDCSIPYLMGWVNDVHYDSTSEEPLMVTEESAFNKDEKEKLTDKEQHFIEVYSQLSEEQQKLVDNLMRTWLSKQ